MSSSASPRILRSNAARGTSEQEGYTPAVDMWSIVEVLPTPAGSKGDGAREKEVSPSQQQR